MEVDESKLKTSHDMDMDMDMDMDEELLRDMGERHFDTIHTSFFNLKVTPTAQISSLLGGRTTKENNNKI